MNNIECRQVEMKINKKTMSIVGWALSALFIITQIGQVVIATISSMLFEDFTKTPIFTWILVSVPIYIMAFPVYNLIMKQLPKEGNYKKSEFTLNEFMVILVIALGSAYIFNFLTAVINVGIGSLKGSPVINPLESVLGNSNIIYTILFPVILAPIMEEIIFRGIFISPLRKFGDKICIFGSAFAFALFHGNLSQLFYAFTLGIIFAYTVVKSGSIKYSILLHIIMNLFGTIIIPSLMSYGKEVVAIYTSLFIIVLMISSIVLFFKNKSKIVLERGNINFTEKEKIIMFFKNPGMTVYVVLSIISIGMATFLA